jgi:hypothetical protein
MTRNARVNIESIERILNMPFLEKHLYNIITFSKWIFNRTFCVKIIAHFSLLHKMFLHKMFQKNLSVRQRKFQFLISQTKRAG